MARRLSSIRSGLQTFALTTSIDACNQLALIWGVQPFFHSSVQKGGEVEDIGNMTMMDLSMSGADATAELLMVGERTLLDADVVDPGETLIMMAGRLSGHGLSSSVIVWTIGEDVPRR